MRNKHQSSTTLHTQLALAGAVTFLWVLSSGNVCAVSPQGEPIAQASPPFVLPKLRPKTEDSTSPPDASSFITVGPDASIGIVPPNQVPGDSKTVQAFMLDGPTPREVIADAVLVLTDGQRFPGRIETQSGTASWISPWHPPRPLTLDGVRAILFMTQTTPVATDIDSVELRNGDRVLGLVNEVSGNSVVVEVGEGTDRKAVTLMLDTVTSISLAGPPGIRAGVRTWLTDGTIIDSKTAEWTNSEYLSLGGVSDKKLGFTAIPRRKILAMQSTPNSGAALASMRATVSESTAASGLRYYQPGPITAPGVWPLDAPPIDIEGPVVLSYEGIKSGSRLIAVAERPQSAKQVGSFDFIVRSGGLEISREHFHSTTHQQELRIDLPPGPFEIELQANGGNIAGCFLRLDRPFIFTR